MGLLENRVAFITGGSSGIGEGTARRFAQEGAAVAIADLQAEQGERVQRDIEAEGGKALYVECDVSSPEAVQRAIDTTVERFGKLDIVFANAGINGVWAPLEELEPEEWDRTLGINLKGTFLTVKYAVPHLKKQGGSIIVTSSVNGTRVFSNTGATAYSSSKAGQVAFTKMIAVELGPHKIRVNVVCPGAIETKIEESTEHRNLEEIRIPAEFPEGDTPLEGHDVGSARHVADLVLFLASDASSHITGTELWIDGGASLVRG